MVVVFLILGLVGAYVLWLRSQNGSQNPNNKNQVSISGAEKEQSKDASNEKDNSKLDQTTSKKDASNTDHAEGITGESTDMTVFAVYTIVRIENKTVSVSAQISGLLYDDGTGTCIHTLTHSDGTQIELVSQILESPGNKYCGAISKNFSELKPGNWTVVTNYNNSNQKYKGISNAQNFMVEK